LDQISSGRAEIMAGRGSFTESFPLFGQDLADYDDIFAEKLDLLLRLRASERVTWSGRHRPPIEDRGVYPRPFQELLPVWIAVGGTPGSVVRTARLGLPMALAIIGGAPARFVEYVELYRQTGRRAGHETDALKVSINSHGFIAETAEEAVELAYLPFTETMNRIGRERGWPPTGRAHFDTERRLEGALMLGSPDDVIEKILYQHDLFGHDRTLIQLTVGPMPHDAVLRAIELLGTVVAPAVRESVGEDPARSQTPKRPTLL
jgi:alkanesulfonate monooxygenase SsuD/methylene tetrahydromethanopterin reductase-like flavin-dependent oxidoreductase (luciferase family)